MDRLDEVAAVADPLLHRVDELLTIAGAAPEHPVWTQLRRVRLLPTDAVRAVAALRPSTLDDAAPQLRRRARDQGDLAASLPPAGAWTGEAADAYDTVRGRLVGHLHGDPESLAERLEASADLGAALVDWMWQTRARVCGALVEVLGSGEATVVSGATTVPAVFDAGIAAGAGEGDAGPVSCAEVSAAATIAATVLRAVADAYDLAEELLDGSAGLSVPASHPAFG